MLKLWPKSLQLPQLHFLFNKHSTCLESASVCYAYDFSNLSLVLCLQYAQNNSTCHVCDLITTLELATPFEDSTNSEKVIQNHTLI